MRIKNILFLSLVFVQVGLSQSVLQQEIDFAVEEKSVSETLQELSEKTGLDIAFSSRFFEADLKISQQFEHTKIETILSTILKTTNVSFKILDDRIILFLKQSPQVFTISGYIKDKKTGERLTAATVFAIKNGKGAISNEYGFYSLTLPEGAIELQTQFLGYQGNVQSFNLKQNIRYDIGLETNITLPEIVVTPETQQISAIYRAPNNAIQLNDNFVKASPGLGGEEDFVRVSQLLPGVQGGIDGLGGVQVRGGESGQNLMLMDGVPVYIPYHLLGVYSVYNSSTINSAQLLKGSFSARYGGRLSSVFDVRIKEGSKENWQGEAAVNLVNAKILIEGPFQKGKGSVLFAGRLAPSGFLLNPEFKRIYFQIDNEDGELTSKFYDFNVKANYAISKKDHIYLSLFSGSDAFSREFEEEIEEENKEWSSDLEFNWANTIGLLRWNHLFNKKLFSNTSLTYSEFSFNNTVFEELEKDDELLNFTFLENSFINKDIGLKIDFDYIPNPKHNIRFGTALSQKNFTTSFVFLEEDDDEVDEIEDATLEGIQDLTEDHVFESLEASAYVEDQISLGEKWYANIGFRGSSFFNEETKYFNIEPRLQLRYHFTPKLSLYTSASKMVQYLHLVTNAALRLPNDLWIASGEELSPSKSFQGELGLAWNANKKLKLNLDAYYKKMNNLLAYPDDRDFLEDIDIENPESFLTKGSGTVYGVELFLKYSVEKTQAGLSYVLSKSQRQYDAQNLGLSYPHEYDQRHQVKLFINQKIGTRFLVGANWIYNSPNPQWGLAYTSLGVDTENQNFIIPGQRNKLRSSAYQRLDLSLSYQYLGSKLSHRVKLGVYNLLNNSNTAFYNLYVDDDVNVREPVMGMPFLPSLSYNLKF